MVGRVITLEKEKKENGEKKEKKKEVPKEKIFSDSRQNQST
jgi:hypothetical protein